MDTEFSGHRITVKIGNDHLETLARPSSSLLGVAELIWNSLDAEARTVSVRLVENELEGIEAVKVIDDGHGMTPEEADAAFSHLGASWKRKASRSKNGKRLLHGREGKGRWRAFSIGSLVRWISVAENGKGRWRTTIQAERSNLSEFEVSEPEPTHDPVGTTVEIENVDPEAVKGLLSEYAASHLTARLAPYFEQAPGVEVTYQGESLDPAEFQANRQAYDIEFDENEHGPISLLVIEWKKHFDRELFLCDENGMALEAMPPAIHAPAFEFTAYLRWSGFREHEPELATADMHPELAAAIQAGRDKLREHFKARGAELQATVLEQWKSEKVYPYEGTPSSPLESATRVVFDEVAVSASRAVNASEDKTSRRLSLRLLKTIVEQQPGSLRNVLQEVLGLSAERLAELDGLLQWTSLDALIALGKTVADRLDFLAGLEIILYDPKTKKELLERRQLHRILERETWIFGDEYALSVSDGGLSRVLERHIALMGRDRLVEDVEPVTRHDGSKGIVDLMFSRSIRLPVQQEQHLVVELKAPKVVLGQAEIGQIESYALAVARDHRFEKVDVQWDFWLLGVSMDDLITAKATQPGRPLGLVTEFATMRVWAKTWSQVIDDCKQRLKFISDRLQFKDSEERALEYLRRHHQERVPASLSPAAEIAATSESVGSIDSSGDAEV